MSVVIKDDSALIQQQLWLNEGFATWVGWLAIDHLYPRKKIYCQ
jgi:hypothetical protein